MGIATLLGLAAGAGVGFAAATRLLSSDDLPERVPTPVRREVNRARWGLREVRDDAAFALREARAERARAGRELMNDYLRRAGRPPRP